MTNAEKRVMRHTTRSIEMLMATIVSMADSSRNAYDGTPAYGLYEKLYLELLAVRDCDEFDALAKAAIPE